MKGGFSPRVCFCVVCEGVGDQKKVYSSFGADFLAVQREICERPWQHLFLNPETKEGGGQYHQGYNTRGLFPTT